MPSSTESNQPSSRARQDGFDPEQDDLIDVREISRRIGKGLPQVIGLALTGLAIGCAVYLVSNRFSSNSTSTRVVFSFPGAGKGLYPDNSKFEPDDLAAPDVIDEAIKSEGLDSTPDFASKIRAALNIEGIIPPDVVKDRDRARAVGQTPAPYIPDEYNIVLTLPRKFPLSNPQRELLVNKIVGAYRNKFQRTYVDLPMAFGNAFDVLHNADYFEYEQILNDEILNITAYLDGFATPAGAGNSENQTSFQTFKEAPNFRSPTTNLSFSDLLNQVEIFSELRLNETLGLIRQNGLSRDRKLALVKMDYYLQILQGREHKAIEDEKVIQDLLSQAQNRAQDYVLGIKSAASQPRPETPILDQGLIDSLLANDSYNFLVRKALDAGLEVKRIQSQEAELLERRKNMESFVQVSPAEQSAIVAQVQKSLDELQAAYQKLIANIRNTEADFAHQQFADAIRLSDAIRTEGIWRPLAVAAVVGMFLGGALGLGLSLLGVYVGKSKSPR